MGVVVVGDLEVGVVGADLDCCLVEATSERAWTPVLWLLLALLPCPVIEAWVVIVVG